VQPCRTLSGTFIGTAQGIALGVRLYNFGAETREDAYDLDDDANAGTRRLGDPPKLSRWRSARTGRSGRA